MPIHTLYFYIPIREQCQLYGHLFRIPRMSAYKSSHRTYNSLMIEQLRKMCMYLIDLIAIVGSAFLQRSDYLRREILKMIRNFPNAAVAPWSMATIWGGASLLKMLLRCMEDLMAKKDWKWDFFINLSESDYPIK